MKDKEKQIENIALIIAGSNIFNQEDYINAKNTAKRIYELLFPEDSVVLSKEEFETLTDIKALQTQIQESLSNMSNEDIANIERRASKETAEKIIDYVYKVTANIVLRDKLAKQFGVEIKE